MVVGLYLFLTIRRRIFIDHICLDKDFFFKYWCLKPFPVGLLCCLLEKKMRSDESSWETLALLETPKQWPGQRGTCFFFFSYSPHFLHRLPHHPSAQHFPILKFPQSFRCSPLHNAQMLSFSPSPPLQPGAIIHNLSVEQGVKEVG